jgi:hypothetical protein
MAIALHRAPRRSVFVDHSWAADVPASPGVYALWDLSSGELVYVGETASLRDRMRDLGRSVNHTCRRKLAIRHKIVGASEEVISAAMSKHYLLSFLPVSLGRIELEEYLSLRHQRTIINSPGRRLLRGATYSWVEAV